MFNLFILIPQMVYGSGRPVSSTNGMPESIVGYGALAGLIFMLLVLYANYKENKKKEYMKPTRKKKIILIMSSRVAKKRNHQPFFGYYRIKFQRDITIGSIPGH